MKKGAADSNLRLVDIEIVIGKVSWVPRRPRSVEHVYLFEFRLPFTFLFSFLCPFLIAHRPPLLPLVPKKS